MTTTMRTTAARPVSPPVRRTPMTPMRKTALLAGGLYLITFFAGIPPTFILYSDILSIPTFITSSGPDAPVLWGGFLEIINAFACIGTAVVLFPVVKRHSEAHALGFVTTRLIEAAVIIVGVISLFTVVTLRQDLAGMAGTDAGSLLTTGHALVAIQQWTALVGPGLMPALNALMLGYVLYRSRLVPRVIPLMGLVGAPLLIASFSATLFGLTDQISVVSALGALPIALWEFSLAIYLVVRGFKPSSLPATGRPSAPVSDPAPGLIT
jgi:hypothetical protein